MSATGRSDRLPEPTDLQARFAERQPVKWGDKLPTAVQLVAEYGLDAARLSLTTLQRRLRTEQRTTSDFLAAVPNGATAYNLDCRVKSPMSLARQFQDRLERDKEGEPDDVLRYTVLCRTSNELVAAARFTTEQLQSRGWAMESAMHSYTSGSRYKGLHADLRTPAGDVVEVQSTRLPRPRSKRRPLARTRLSETRLPPTPNEPPPGDSASNCPTHSPYHSDSTRCEHSAVSR